MGWIDEPLKRHPFCDSGAFDRFATKIRRGMLGRSNRSNRGGRRKWWSRAWPRGGAAPENSSRGTV